MKKRRRRRCNDDPEPRPHSSGPNALHPLNRVNASTAPAAQTAGASQGTSYTVQSGDNLYRIAIKYYGQGGRWPEIYNANQSVIANPKRIYAGQTLVIP